MSKFVKLMTFKAMKAFINSYLPNEKATLIYENLKNHCFISNGSLYTLDSKNKAYKKNEKESTYDNDILSLLSEYLESSMLALKKDEQDELRYVTKQTEKDNNDIVTLKKENPNYKKSFNNYGIKEYIPQFKTLIQNNDIKLDDTPYELHFINGYIDLKDVVFKKRVIGKHFIVHYIQQEYFPSTAEQRNEILNHIKKIYPRKEDMNYILSQYGRALTGMCHIDQTNLILVGLGSTGKSVLLEILQDALGPYFLQLPSDTFELDNKNRNKILNDFDVFPVRVVWINEMTDKKIDDSLYKKFVDGQLQTTRLYHDGTIQLLLKCKIVSTSNDLVNIKIDTGTKRRMEAYTHTSLFTSDMSEVDEKKNIYLKNKDLKEELKNRKMYNAFIDILVEHAKLWIEKKSPQEPESFKDAKELIVSTNDVFKDFVDKHIIRTSDAQDRIGKNEMRVKFLQMYPNKHLTVQQIMVGLREKKIEYNTKLRADGIQGCYICVKFKEDNNQNNNSKNNDEYDNIDYKNACKIAQNKIEYLEEANRKLLEEVENLKRQLYANETRPIEGIEKLKIVKKEKKMKIVRNLEGDDVAEEKEEVSNIEKKEDTTILPKKNKKIETKNIDGDNSKLLDSLGFIVMG